MKFKKLLLLTVFSLSLTGCSVPFVDDLLGKNKNEVDETKKENTEDEIKRIYRLYRENGGELSYEDWLASIKGEKGDTGNQGPKGDTGKDGRSIIDVRLESSLNGVDTYRIYFSDQTSTTFTVSNGKDGNDGLTPYIGQNGHWFIGDTDTGFAAGMQEGPTDFESFEGNDYFKYNVDENLIVEFSESDESKEYEISEQVYDYLSWRFPYLGVAKFTYEDGCMIETYLDPELSSDDDTYKIIFELESDEYPSIVIGGKLRDLEDGFEIPISEDYLTFSDWGFYFAETYANNNEIDVMSLDDYMEYIIDGIEREIAETIPNVETWIPYGASYSSMFTDLVDDIEDNHECKMTTYTKGSPDSLRRDMLNAINIGYYPNLALSYSTSIYDFLGCDILKPFDAYLDQNELDDYFPSYMGDNYFYNNNGENHLYSLPFSNVNQNLIYNGIFVDYCGSINPSLKTIPQTWQEWATKGPLYLEIYDSLVDNHKIVFGRQETDGTAYDFEINDMNEPTQGRIELLDFSFVPESNMTYMLTFEDGIDGFETLIRQWGAEFTNVPEDQNQLPLHNRVGNVLFGSSENKGKVEDCLEFIYDLYSKRIFATSNQLNSSFASDALISNKTMFCISSTGGLKYIAANNDNRFRVAPIPYFDDGTDVRKIVLSKNTNICMTDCGGTSKNAEVAKALTTGEVQAKWCVSTGYYPTSKSAVNSSTYQNFLNSTSFENPAEVLCRESALVNKDEYQDLSKNWTLINDDVFRGLSVVKDCTRSILNMLFATRDQELEINEILSSVLHLISTQSNGLVNIIE